MFTEDIASYTIDLTQPESSRWSEVIAAEKETATQLLQSANDMLPWIPRVASLAFAKLYQWSGGLYQDEIQAWANAIGSPPDRVTLLNCAYELSHIRPPKPFGCSAGITSVEGLGMVHVRTLDWPIAGMGAATRIFRLRRGDHEAIVVGFPGMVGALSGMVPGAYSVTINWAPPGTWLPKFEFGPTFLLRDVLETCPTYDVAVKRLQETQLATSVFFTICGAELGQGCVIERTPKDAVVRPYLGHPLVQTNHHVDQRFEANNDDIREGEKDDDVFSLDGSQKRRSLLNEQLAAFKGPVPIDALLQPLNIPTVLNGDTCQKMVFVPKQGESRVLRKMGD